MTRNDSESPLAAQTQLISLPTEILGDIFLHSIPELGDGDGPRAHFPWILSHVCRYWRTTALSFQKLWSFLDVEQTQENEEGESPTPSLMETYLARSGEHPLSFRLVYSPETIHGHPFLETLCRHSRRWKDVQFVSLPLFALGSLSEGEEDEYPILRSIVFSRTEFDPDAVGEQPILNPIPWSQLTRYHEHECPWYPNSERQWEIIQQLASVVDFCAAFNDVSGLDSPIQFPRLKFASLAIDRRSESSDLSIDDVLDCFDAPHLEGLNLNLVANGATNPLIRMPQKFPALKILRLCGIIGITELDLMDVLSHMPTLTETFIDMQNLDATPILRLFATSTGGSTVVPKLQVLRFANLSHVDQPRRACTAPDLYVALAVAARLGNGQYNVRWSEIAEGAGRMGHPGPRDRSRRFLECADGNVD
ncbi:hypothetical protein B0H10DRAFT_862807 [Mycena sp. CBHHK59/15]|nr:hypothetical protein B0H10DRAFT_862807 [Mycena sp. CBHHK59/15]